jgi:octaprenyl-diphosphate synthase
MVSSGIVNERTYRGACVIELIHTATLVHDDVVDDSNRRRGFLYQCTLIKLPFWLVIIYCLKDCCFLLIMAISDLLRIISVAVREMSESELLKLKNSKT